MLELRCFPKGIRHGHPRETKKEEKEKMKGADMKEDLKSMSEDINEKVKVMFPEIVVHGTKDKPFYEIKYYEVADKEWHLGYGSYNLEYVMQWKEELLEVVEGNIISGAFEKIIKRLKANRAYHLKERARYYWNDAQIGLQHLYAADAYSEALEIVKEVAAEFATDTNVGSKTNNT